MKILRNLLVFIIISFMLVILTGCSNNINIADEIGEIGIDDDSSIVEITIPSEFLEEQTQDELTVKAIENGYESITLNDDGSATYKMTKAQHKKLMDGLTDTFNRTLNEMVGSKEYPNFTEIKANDNFTDFTIKTTSTELDFNEAFSVMAFYMYGGMYSIYSGEEVDNIHVKFINDSTGEIISESNSKDMAQTEE